ncbi:MAG TPA: PrsW family glutamic-type intramembrane protease [Thermoleophilaceae bacterium]|nr:PrsW family glutamic-type intramembrane protease [Thermoleophilaceae bacterium]
MTSPLPQPAGGPTAASRPLPAPGPRRRGPRRALAALGIIALLLAGLLTLLVIGVEVGPVALATGLVLAVLPVPVYVALALFVDRFEPEPPQLLAWAFFWGATGATLIALIVNSAGQALVGSTFGSAVGELYGASLSAPVVEEGSKAIVLLAIYRWRRAEFDGVLDGIVYAAMVGLGFAFAENVLYYARTALEGGVPLAAVFFVRGVLAPFAHPVFTALTGVGLGLVALRPSLSGLLPAVGLLGAMILHSIWNTSAGVAGGLGFLTVYVGVMVPVFLVLVAVAVGALLRERRVLREYLQPELASGLLSHEDLATLSSLRERRRALQAAKRQGPAARRGVEELHHVATELAFLRRHIARRPQRRGEDLAGREAAYTARLQELRAALPLASSAAAPATAALVAQAPAAWYRDPYGQARLRWWDGWRWTEHTAG